MGIGNPKNWAETSKNPRGPKIGPNSVKFVLQIPKFCSNSIEFFHNFGFLEYHELHEFGRILWNFFASDPDGAGRFWAIHFFGWPPKFVLPGGDLAWCGHGFFIHYARPDFCLGKFYNSPHFFGHRFCRPKAQQPRFLTFSFCHTNFNFGNFSPGWGGRRLDAVLPAHRN